MDPHLDCESKRSCRVVSLSPESKAKVLIVMVLNFHFSQFLLFSDSPMTLPNSLNYCVVRQDHLGQVGNQKHLRKYSYPLVYFAAFSIHRQVFLKLEAI